MLRKKLDQAGVSHFVLPLLVVFLIAAAGIYSIVSSHADAYCGAGYARKANKCVKLSRNPVKKSVCFTNANGNDQCFIAKAYRDPSFVPKRPSAALVKRAKVALGKQWNICNEGSTVKIRYYRQDQFFKGNPLYTGDYPHIDPDAFAYAYVPWAKSPPGYDFCTVFVNDDSMSLVRSTHGDPTYREEQHSSQPLYFNMYTPMKFCSTMVHEGGHMSGFKEDPGYLSKKTNRHNPAHSSNISSIMYGGFGMKVTAAVEECAQ